MSASSEVRSQLFYGWDLGEVGWNDEMDANLIRLGRFAFHLSVKDRDQTTPPESPVVGDCYIVGFEATDDWVSLDDYVVIWDGTVWQQALPRTGWVAFIEDEVKLSVFIDSVGWSAGVEL